MLASVLYCLAPAAASALQAPAEFFGVNGQQLRSVHQAPIRDRQVAQIRQLGIGWVRINVPWRALEPLPPLAGRHAYSWNQFDSLVADLALQGLRMQPVLLGTPAWAAHPGKLALCGSVVEPGSGSYGDYASAMAALARRYGAGGSFWASHPQLPSVPVRQYEVWNEQNMRAFWCPLPDPRSYAALFGATAAAVRSVDPAAQVGIGGLAPVRTTDSKRIEVGEFLRRSVAARPALAQEVSLVFAHPYASRPEGVIGQLPWWREAIDTAGLRGTPIVTNEWGWYTRGHPGLTGPVTEEQRAAGYGYVAERMWRTDCGVVGTAPHTWVSEELNAKDENDWFGIASPTGLGPYPTALAYGDQIARSAASVNSPAKMVRLCGAPCVLQGFAAKRRRGRIVLRFDADRASRVKVKVKRRRRGRLRRVAVVSASIPRGRSARRLSAKLARRKLAPRRAYRLVATASRDSIGCDARVAKLKRRRR